MCVCFLWQSNELLILPLLGVSTIPLEFQSALLSLCTGGLFLFFIFIFFPFYFLSSRRLFHVVYIFVFRGHCRLFHPQSLSPSLALHTVYPRTLSLRLMLPVFPTRFSFSFSAFTAPATLYPLQWGCLPCRLFFFLPVVFSSPLSSPYLPLLLLLLLATTPLKSFHSLFTSVPFPPPSLAASNMLYSLSCFPECEECCCFPMSPA